MVPHPISFYPFEKTKRLWEFAISWNCLCFIMCFSYINGFYWGENVAFSFLFQQCLIVKHYKRFQHACISVCLPSFLLKSSHRVFWFDSVQASSIKCVVGKKSKKNRRRKRNWRSCYFGEITNNSFDERNKRWLYQAV
jgi:hypothetical protein